MLTVYAYERCSTCRKALAWLTGQGISCTVKPIRDEPPSTAELKRMLAAHGGVVRKLFNTSGLDYRAQGLGAKLDGMDAEQAIALLHGNGNLVKRPFVLGEGVALVGFDPAAWTAALATGGTSAAAKAPRAKPAAPRTRS